MTAVTSACQHGAMAEVLLVDDDRAVRESMAVALRRLGHEVTAVEDGPAALAALAPGHRCDVVLLDVMMPGINGFETCRRIRVTNGLPIVMLTARGDDTDVVAGLECGADDYVVKPVSPRVLDARIKALLRRGARSDEAPVARLGELVVDMAAMRVTRDGVDLGLTPMEFRLLEVLLRNAGQVLTRAVLLDRVWDYKYGGDSRLVDSTLQRLRARIEPDPAHPTHIHTVRGVGYRLDR